MTAETVHTQLYQQIDRNPGDVMATSLSANELTAELQAHGLAFLVGRQPAPSSPRLSSTHLLANLARQEDARLRVALIALFLSNTTVADAVPATLSQVDGKAQMTLKVYYTAAVILQEKYTERLRSLSLGWFPLPDLFSRELGLPTAGDPQMRLQQLGQLHHQVTGLTANWPGTYEYAALRLIRRLEKEALWMESRSLHSATTNCYQNLSSHLI